MINSGQKDMELFWRWKKTNSKKDLNNLLKSLQPIIAKASDKWRGSVPDSVMDAELHGLAVEALKSFNPNAGVKISTHLMSRLQKISRLTYSNNSIYKIPENRAIQLPTYLSTKEDLKNQFGREPTRKELAKQLGWKQKEVQRMEDEDRQSFQESAAVDGSLDIFSVSNGFGANVHYLYFDLSPDEKKLFSSLIGYNGSPKLSNQQIMINNKWTQSEFNKRKNSLVKKMKKYKDML